MMFCLYHSPLVLIHRYLGRKLSSQRMDVYVRGQISHVGLVGLSCLFELSGVGL